MVVWKVGPNSQIASALSSGNLDFALLNYSSYLHIIIRISRSWLFFSSDGQPSVKPGSILSFESTRRPCLQWWYLVRNVCRTNILVEEKSSKRIANSQFLTLSNPLNSTCFTVLPLLVEKSLEHVHLLSLFQGLGVARVLKRRVHQDAHFMLKMRWETCAESKIFLNLVLNVLVRLLPMASPSDWDCFISCLLYVEGKHDRNIIFSRILFLTFQTHNSRALACASRPQGDQQSWSPCTPPCKSSAPARAVTCEKTPSGRA